MQKTNTHRKSQKRNLSLPGMQRQVDHPSRRHKIRLTTREPKGRLITVKIELNETRENLHSHPISTAMYEKIDPWLRRSKTSLRANGEEMAFSNEAGDPICSVVHDSDREREEGSSECNCREPEVAHRGDCDEVCAYAHHKERKEDGRRCEEKLQPAVNMKWRMCNLTKDDHTSSWKISRGT